MIYNIGTFNDADEFLQLIATSRGKLKKGGRVDVEVGVVDGGLWFVFWRVSWNDWQSIVSIMLLINWLNKC